MKQFYPILYPQPHELARSPHYRVWINGEEAPVLHSGVAALVCFATDGPVSVRVEIAWGDPHHVVLRPLAKGCACLLDHNVLTFEMDGPGQCVADFDTHRERSIYFFADPLAATEPPPEDGRSWRTFEAGKVHDIGELMLAPDENCWIPAGAVVRGSLLAKGVRGTVIRGPGILLGDFQTALGPMAVCDGRLRPTCQLAACEDVELRDLLVLDSRAWTTVVVAGENIRLRNHKVVTWSICDDGLDIVGSKNVSVSDSFICSRDDCVSIKAVDYLPFLAVDGARDVADIRVERCVFVNADCGNGLEVGMEMKTDSVRGIVFSDCDILRVELEGNLSGAALSVHCGNWAAIEDVRFEDIRIEQALDKFVDVGVFHSPYDTDTRRGTIRDIRFSRIRLMGNLLPRSFVRGADAEHPVRGVVFEDVAFGSAKYRGFLNALWGIPTTTPPLPERPLREALRETLVLEHAEAVTVR